MCVACTCATDCGVGVGLVLSSLEFVSITSPLNFKKRQENCTLHLRKPSLACSTSSSLSLLPLTLCAFGIHPYYKLCPTICILISPTSSPPRVLGAVHFNIKYVLKTKGEGEWSCDNKEIFFSMMTRGPGGGGGSDR